MSRADRIVAKRQRHKASAAETSRQAIYTQRATDRAQLLAGIREQATAALARLEAHGFPDATMLKLANKTFRKNRAGWQVATSTFTWRGVIATRQFWMLGDGTLAHTDITSGSWTYELKTSKAFPSDEDLDRILTGLQALGHSAH